MEEFFGLLKEYGPYVGLPLIIAGITQALKLALAPFFQRHSLGIRLMPFVPVVLGMVGGLLLPGIETIRERIFIGGGLGTVSPLIYKMVTTTFGSVEAVEAMKKPVPTIPPPPPEVTP